MSNYYQIKEAEGIPMGGKYNLFKNGEYIASAETRHELLHLAALLCKLQEQDGH